MQQYLDIFLGSPVHKNFHLKVLQSLESAEIEFFLRFVLVESNAEELHLSKCVMNRNEILRILRLGKSLKTLSFNEVLLDVDGQDKHTNGIEAKFLNDLKQLSELTRLEVTTCVEEDAFPWVQVLSKTPHLQV